MDKLNIYCLMELHKYFDLKDQIAVKQAMPCMQDMIEQDWAAKYTTLVMNFFELQMSDEDFGVFMDFMHPKLEIVSFKNLSESKYKVIQRYEFPNVHDFRFYQQSPFYLKDKDMLTLQRIFPNLKTFSPHGRFTGRFIKNWANIEHLTLSFCERLKVTHFNDILKSLNLKSLKMDIFDKEISLTGNLRLNQMERVFLNSCELMGLFSNRLHEYYSLEELTLSDRESSDNLLKFYSELHNDKPNRIVEVETCGYSDAVPYTVVFNFNTNIKKLAFVNEEAILTYLPQAGILCNLPSLRELYFFMCDIENVATFKEILKLTPQVEYLSFENCGCHFTELRLDIKDVVDEEKRRRPLTFNYYGNFMKNPNGLDNPCPCYFLEPPNVPLIINGTHALLNLTSKRSSTINYQPLKLKFT